MGLYCALLYISTILHCTVLYSNTRYCIVLCSTVIHGTVLYCALLYISIILYCTVLYSNTRYCIVLYSTVIHGTVLYCTVLYSLPNRGQTLENICTNTTGGEN